MTSSTFDPAHDELFIASRKEIVFIEDNVADIDTLIKGIGSGKEIVILDSTQDGVHQIAQALAGRSGIDALHVIAHGTEGAADFGALQLKGANTGAHSGDLAAIGLSMAAGGDILLYGCNIGAGENGAGFLEQLSIATGADVAGSNDKTGSAALGGDWDLEVTSGSIETPVVVNAQTAALYQQVLSIPSVTVSFTNFNNFSNPPAYANDPTADAIYNVNGNSNYQLKIDGQDHGATSYISSPSVSVAPNAGDRSVTISFATGQIFTANSIAIANYFANAAPQTLVIKGYDSAHHQVGSTATPTLAFGADAFAPIPITLTGMTGISSLTITATTFSNQVQYLLIDDLSLSNIQPPPPPHVNSVTSSTANGTYPIGHTIDVQVNFDQAVDVTGTPQLTLETGTTDRTINYVSGSGSSQLTFSYTVLSGDLATDLDYLGSAINPHGGTITVHGGSTDANLTLPTPGSADSLAGNKNIVIDGVAPNNPSVPVLASADDKGASSTDGITNTGTLHFSGTAEVGATVKLYDANGVTEIGNGTADGGGNWTITTSPALAEGLHTIKAKAFDAAGNASGIVTGPDVTVDTTAPTLSIASSASTMKAGETATITFTFNEDPGATFTWNGSSGDVSVSGGTLSAIQGSGITRTATFTPTANTNNGTASISVSAGAFSDAAGNSNTSASASPSITYDTKAPNSPSAPILAGADDKGASSTDGITNTGTLHFSGTADAGATVRLYDTNGVTEIGSATADGSGNWTIATSPALASGTHTIKAMAFDAAGNASSLVTGPDVTVDTAPPTLSIASSASTMKAGETATITFTFSEDPGATFTGGSITVDGGTLGAIIGSGTTRTATFTPTAGVDAGSAHISVAAGAYHDLAGNDGAAGNSLTLGYDTLAPAVPGAPNLATGNDSGASNSDDVTRANPLSFSGSADNGATVRLYDGAAEIGHVTASGGTYTIAVTDLGEGSHTLTAIAYDAAGNASAASGGLTLKVDRTPPSTTVASAALSADTGPSNTDMITKAATPQTVSGTLSANLAAGEQVLVSLDNGASWNPASASAGANTWSLDVTLAGSGTLKVQVVDLAGNTGAVYSQAFILDQTPPAAPSAPDLDSGSDSGSSDIDNVTGVTLPAFSGTAEVGATVKLFDSGVEIGSAVAADGTWHITTSSATPLTQRPDNSPHVITAIATDLAGNSSASSATLEVQVLTGGPATTVASIALASDSGVNGDFITKTPSQTVSGTLSANLAAGEHVQVSLNNGGTWTNATGTAGQNTWSLPVALTEGTHDIQVRVIDAADNTGAVLTQAYTLDTVKPAVAITSSAAQLKIGETPTITFTFSEDPGASFDGSDVTVSGGTLSAIQGSGAIRTAIFTPTADTNGGTASIVVNANSYADLADNAGTAGATPSLTFDTLAPNNPSAPVLATADDKGASSTDGITNTGTLHFSGTADAGATVRLYDTNGVTEIGSATADGSGNWTVLTSPALANGTHTIKAMAFDAAGNASSLVTGPDVTVDTAPPTLSIASSASMMKAGETATITFTFSEDPGATFTSGSITIDGGTLSAIQGSGTTRTATFTPTAGVDAGSAHISVAAGTYHDLAGNDGAAGNNITLGYDTLAPTTPGAPNLASGNDSGASDSDDVTRANLLSFSGSADNGATVKLYDGATEVGHATASGGTYTIAVTGLGEDSHTLTAIAYDAAGNASAASAGLTVVVDRTPSSTTVASAALSSDSGPSSTDMITKEDHQTISGTLSANLAAGEQVLVSIDNGATWSPATASTGANTWSLAAVLAASGTLKVQVVDLAGNTGAVYSQAYTLDQTPPAAPSTPDLDSGSDGGSSDTDNVTGVTLPAFSGTAEVGATVKLFDGGVEIGSAVAADGTWHITTSSATPMSQRPDNSPHTITAIATDLAGNSSASSLTLEVHVLTGGPATTVASIALSNDSGVNGDFVTKTLSQTVSGTLSANLAAGEHVQVSLNNGSIWINTISTVGQNTWSLPVALTEGTHDIQVRVVDAADNVGTVLTQAYTLDTVKPAVAITSSTAQLKFGETATITFTFSEDPGASFDGSDLTVSGGTLSPISGSGAVRTAIFTPTADTNGGTASIVVNANSYADLADNAGTAGATPSLRFDTLAPAAPSAPDLHKDSDSGALDTDNLTHDAAPVFTGTAEAGATVRLYDTDTDGVTEIGHGTADGSGNWTITTSTLLDGSHTVTAKSFDAAGNASPASSALTVTIDTVKPAAMAAPVLAAGSDSGAPGDGITKVAKPTFKGTAEANAQVTLYDGAAVLGTATADGLGVWTFTPAANLSDSAHAITARQADRAGNQSDAGVALSLTVDTLAPAAPTAPLLKATSDTGIAGDGVTENGMPVIEGTALANTLVTLYDDRGRGSVKIGTAMADASGKWSIATPGMAVGGHSLTATQSDAAGNESATSAVFLLRITTPPVQLPLVDGVPVDTQPISLPGGVIGSAVSIPIVSAGREESSGHAGVADIPLLKSGDGSSLLLAQVPAGIGLSASGASVPQANGAQLLLAAIKAATPSHAASDQGYLTGNGQSFLDGLSAGGTLLVETVKPVSAPNAPDAVLTLSGPAQPHGQSTALVIDAGGLGAGATIALQDLSFAAVIGAANVVSTGSMILTGDAASQHFTVAAGTGPNAVLAGGGNDTLTLSPSGSGAGAVMLHGGAASDVAAFSGARADYNVDFHNGYVTVTTKAGPATMATVVNVETLQFSDGSVTVQNSADMNTLAGLYQTVLGRQADISGIEFWANGHQAGVNWGNIALNMIGSSERLASHEGFTGVAAHDLTLLYTALFNRTPDAEGLAFWANAMAHGVSLEHVAGEFVLSVEMIGHQRAALDWEFIAA
jgi:hypothetical protein